MKKVKYVYVATLNDKVLFFTNSFDEIQEWLGNIPAITFEESCTGDLKNVTNENGEYSFFNVPEYKYRNHL